MSVHRLGGRRTALLRRARVQGRRQTRHAWRFAQMAMEAVGRMGQVWRPVRRDDFGQGTGRPVLLLHGFAAPRRILHVLERRLRRTLGVAVMSFHLPGLGGAFTRHDISQEAARLAEKLERLCVRHGVTEMDLIGHSKGGFVARYMVSHFPVGQRVRTLVALGTPFSGTPLAYLGAVAMGLFSKTVWQMTPNSRFIRAQREVPLPAHIHAVSISGTLDMVAPTRQCRLPVELGAPGQIRNYVVDGVGHNSLLMSRRVFKIIVAELGGRMPPPDPTVSGPVLQR